MALIEKIVEDLLEKVKKIEQQLVENNEFHMGADRLLHQSSTIDAALCNLLIEKKLVTQEELQSALKKEMERIDKLYRQFTENKNERSEADKKAETDSGSTPQA